MKSEFSEQTYGFQVGHEIISLFESAGCIVDQYHPSTVEEVSKGYDVRIRFASPFVARSLFLQYKVSEYLVRSRTMPTPCLRFKISRKNHSAQHNLLVLLAQSGEDVYYSAPLFHQKAELSFLSQRKKVSEHSLMTNPIEMGPINDPGQHYVYYHQSTNSASFLSSPTKIAFSIGAKDLVGKLKSRHIDYDYLSKLHGLLVESVESVWKKKVEIPEDVRDRQKINEIAYLLDRFFGASWILLSFPVS